VHYLRYYKALPGRDNPVEIGDPYDRVHAERVIEAALADYREKFPRTD
jgi:hypothetical protein